MVHVLSVAGSCMGSQTPQPVTIVPLEGVKKKGEGAMGELILWGL